MCRTTFCKSLSSIWWQGRGWWALELCVLMAETLSQSGWQLPGVWDVAKSKIIRVFPTVLGVSERTKPFLASKEQMWDWAGMQPRKKAQILMRDCNLEEQLYLVISMALHCHFCQHWQAPPSGCVTLWDQSSRSNKQISMADGQRINKRQEVPYSSHLCSKISFEWFQRMPVHWTD